MPINLIISRRVQVAITATLLLVGAVCLLKYFAWASVFSGSYGLASRTETVAVSKHWSLVYLWFGLLAECALIANLMATFKLKDSDLPPSLRILGRLIISIGIAGG